MSAARSLLVVVALSAFASWAWRAHVAGRDGEALRLQAKPGDIRMLSSQTCGWCTAARRWMTQEGIPFQECFIEGDAQCRADYEALGAAGTPTLLVRGRRVIGFDKVAILVAMK